MGNFRVAGPKLGLVIFVPVPIETEPAHAVQDGVDRLLGGTCPVRVLDPKQEFAAGVPRVEPVEQSGPGTPDMEVTGGRGGETGDDRPCAHARFPLLSMLQCN